MIHLRATCKVTTGRTPEAITELGGLEWRMTVKQVVDAIDAGTHTFYTDVGGTRANLEVAEDASGERHLRTVADGTTTNELMSLRDCGPKT